MGKGDCTIKTFLYYVQAGNKKAEGQKFKDVILDTHWQLIVEIIKSKIEKSRPERGPSTVTKVQEGIKKGKD